MHHESAHLTWVHFRYGLGPGPDLTSGARCPGCRDCTCDIHMLAGNLVVTEAIDGSTYLRQESEHAVPHVLVTRNLVVNGAG
jgi:hypothetical protein